jgi:hypothetical protein
METQTLELKLSVLHVNAILQTLSQAPYAVAAPIIEVIRQQAASQLAATTQVYQEPVKEEAAGE